MRALIISLLVLLSFPLMAGKEGDQVKRSLRAFKKASLVLQHPRCLNCHPAGDRPTQGMDMHIHTMNVKRGPKDLGQPGMKCMTCHQDQNNLSSGVPGAPKWALAPREMAWQGLSLRELCLLMKDEKRTHKNMEEMMAHNEYDELVGWGWKPGKGREPAPFSQKEFAATFREWVETGAHCPEN